MKAQTCNGAHVWPWKTLRHGSNRNTPPAPHRSCRPFTNAHFQAASRGNSHPGHAHNPNCDPLPTMVQAIGGAFAFAGHWCGCCNAALPTMVQALQAWCRHCQLRSDCCFCTSSECCKCKLVCCGLLHTSCRASAFSKVAPSWWPLRAWKSEVAFTAFET